jgi:hypothetical protein
MKKDTDRIDNLFREGLGGIKIIPTRSVWKGIRSKYLKNLPGKLSFLNFPNIIAALVITSTGIALLTIGHHMLQTKEQERQKIIPGTSEQVVASTLPQAADHPILSSSPEANIDPPAALIKSLTEQVKAPDSAIVSNISTNPKNVSTIKGINAKPIASAKPDVAQNNLYGHQQILTGDEQNTLSLMTSAETTPSFPGGTSIERYTLTSMPVITNFSFQMHAPIPYWKTSSLPVTPDFMSDDYRRPSTFELGIYYIPEVIDYRKDTRELKQGYNLELSATYHRSEFFLRGGIGIGFSEDNGDYVINYNRYDSVGYYYGVNYFNITPGHPDSVVFSTFIQTIYDSVFHSDPTVTKNRYTYLQFPLNVGFDFYRFHRFNFSLMTGPVFSILIRENEKTATFDDPKATLMGIDNLTQDRIKTNWQFAVSLGISYQLSNRLRFSLEPTYKYYIRSVYDKPEAGQKRPYSLGLRAGMLIKF